MTSDPPNRAGPSRALRFGLELSNMGACGDPRALASLAVEAESAGWDGVFIWDIVHFETEDKAAAVTCDPWISLAAMALATHQIRLGTLITPVSRRRPWLLARETVTLDHLSNGRLILSVGLGVPADGAFSKVNEPADRVLRAELLDEGLSILQGLWSGVPYHFHGRHYSLQEMLFLPRPLQEPRIPVWVVAAWKKERSLARALRWDGILPVRFAEDGKNMDRDGFALAGGMSVQDIVDLKRYSCHHRQGNGRFDIILEGLLPEDRKKAVDTIKPYADAGATWWIDTAWHLTHGKAGGLDALIERIRRGPPNLFPS